VNVLDSSGWLEYFSDGPNANTFEAVLLETDQLVIPTIILYEVSKKIILEAGESEANQAIALMMQGHVVPLDENLALLASRISVMHKLPMADSIILATAIQFNATLWTQDADFEGLPHVKYFPK
jgi:predicted nucleic acid-binding protein